MAQQLRIDVRLPQGHWAGDVTRDHPTAILRIEQHMPMSKGRGTARCWSNENLHETVRTHAGIDACTNPEDGRFRSTSLLVAVVSCAHWLTLASFHEHRLKSETVGLSGRLKAAEKP